MYPQIPYHHAENNFYFSQIIKIEERLKRFEFDCIDLLFFNQMSYNYCVQISIESKRAFRNGYRRVFTCLKKSWYSNGWNELSISGTMQRMNRLLLIFSSMCFQVIMLHTCVMVQKGLFPFSSGFCAILSLSLFPFFFFHNLLYFILFIYFCQ